MAPLNPIHKSVFKNSSETIGKTLWSHFSCVNEKTRVQRILKKPLRDEGGFPQNSMRSFVKIFAVVVVMEHKEEGLVEAVDYVIHKRL